MPACCPLDGLDPQSRLWRALLAEYPQAAAERELCWEYTGAVPGRRFRVDILWWTPALAIEVDGYEFHGRIKAGFHRDRQKDRLLSASGWTCVRFSAREISKDLAGVVAELKRLRNQRLPDR
jgi:very-short-patch-repair endonuclease